MLVDIKSLNDEELENFVTDGGFPKFRAKQIRLWLSKNVVSFDEMRNISTDLRDFLKTSSYISVANIEKKLVSRYDKTVKYLFSFNDGECVEAVVMSYKTAGQCGYQLKSAVKWAVPFVQQEKAAFHAVLPLQKCLHRLRRLKGT